MIKAIGAWFGLVGVFVMLLIGTMIALPILFALVWLPDFRERQRHVRALRNARRLPEPDNGWWAAQHRGRAPAE